MLDGTDYPKPSPQEQTVRAALAWLDAGGDGPRAFHMADALCGTYACIGGFMARYAATHYGMPFDVPAHGMIPEIEHVGEWLGMTADEITDLFFDWPDGETTNATSAAARLRAAFPQFATVPA